MNESTSISHMIPHTSDREFLRELDHSGEPEWGDESVPEASIAVGDNVFLYEDEGQWNETWYGMMTYKSRPESTTCPGRFPELPRDVSLDQIYHQFLMFIGDVR